MARIAKANGSTTVTGKDGKIVGNVPMAALTGPMKHVSIRPPAPEMETREVEARDMVAAKLINAHTIADAKARSELSKALRAMDSNIPGAASYDEVVGYARGVTSAPTSYELSPRHKDFGPSDSERRVIILMFTKWFAALAADETAQWTGRDGEVKHVDFGMVRDTWLSKGIDSAVAVDYDANTIAMTLEGGEQLVLERVTLS